MMERVGDVNTGEEPPVAPDSAMGSGPPQGSSQRDAWLDRLRDRLRARLFSSVVHEAGGTTDPDRSDRGAGDGVAMPEQIGRYEVLGRIGKGGMGVIYSALDRDLGRKVAVNTATSSPTTCSSAATAACASPISASSGRPATSRPTAEVRTSEVATRSTG
jgi:hypothetical protein